MGGIKMSEPKKNQPKRLPADPRPTTKGEPEIPPFLRDLFGLPPAEPQRTEEKVEDEVDVEIDLTEETDTEIPDYQMVDTGETDQLESFEYEKPLHITKETEPASYQEFEIKKLLADQKQIGKKQKKYAKKLVKGSLQQAIIMKEILDKPVSLRTKKPGIIPFGKI